MEEVEGADSMEDRYVCPGTGCPKSYARLDAALRHGNSCVYYARDFGREPIRYACTGPGCEKSYSRPDGLRMHHRKCSLYHGLPVEQKPVKIAVVKPSPKPPVSIAEAIAMAGLNKSNPEASFVPIPDCDQQTWTVELDHGPTLTWSMGRFDSQPPTVAQVLTKLAVDHGAWDKIKSDGDLALDFVFLYLEVRGLGKSATVRMN